MPYTKSRSRIRQNLDVLVQIPKSGDFGYGQNSQSPRMHPAPGLLRTALALVLVASFPGTAAAQSYWELSPYSIRVIVAFESAPQFHTRFQEELLPSLAQRAEVAAGAAWQASFEIASPRLRHRMLRDITSIPAEAFAAELDDRDKIVLLTLAIEPDGYTVAARELDCPTHRWSLPQTRIVRQQEQLASALFRTWSAAFAPLARVSDADAQVATLELRAGALPPADPAWRQAALGSVFHPIVRQNERDGSSRPGGIEPVPWTLLQVGEIDGGRLRSTIHSGMRSPLAVRRRGRTDLFALAVEPGDAPTTLELRSREDEPQPLAGYEIFSQSPSSSEMQRLGLTDRDGRLPISPNADPLRVLYVKHGSRLLARLPIVPGQADIANVALVDDDPRLRVEGQLLGLEETLVDLVARREMLLARIHTRLDEDDADGAAQLLAELRRLPTREQFAQRIAQLEQRTNSSSDPALQAEIARLFDRTKALLGKYLDVRRISEVQTLVDRAKEPEA